MRNREDDLHDVLAVASAEPKVIAQADADRYLELLADDAVYLPPNAAAKTGSELRSWLSQFVRDASVEWLEYQDGATTISGDLAVHDYSYVWRVTPRKGGEATIGRGKGVQVLSRQADGAWKLLRNIWNAGPSAA